MFFEIIRLDLPQRSSGEHQRVEVLSIDKHIQAREVVAWNPIRALVMRLVPTTRRPQNGLALRAALRGIG